MIKTLDSIKSFIPNNGNNKLISKTFNGTFLPCCLLALTYNINGLIDSVLSGAFFSPLHIAAIGIVLPIHVLFTALLDIFVYGTSAAYTTTLGRGQRRKSKEIFTVGLLYIVLFGTILSVCSIIFSDFLVTLFGAATEELKVLAVQYLKFTALTIPFVGVTKLITLILGIYGYQKYTLIANIVNLIFNVGLSVVFVLFVPQIGIGGLGLGTLFATIPAVIVCYIAAKKHNIPMGLGMRIAGLKAKRFKEMFLGGLGVSMNALIDGLMSGVINWIVVSSSLGTTGLAAYSIVQGFWSLSHVSAEGMDFATGPLMGVCYTCGDKGGLKAIFASSVKKCLLFTVIWVAMIFAASPLLMKIYLIASDGTADLYSVVRTGMFCTLAFAPIFSLNYLFTSFFDIAGNLKISVAFAIIPDSVLYPILLAVLLPQFGYIGIWLALGGNTAVFFIIAYIILAIKKRSVKIPIDEVLHLENGKCADYPAIDVSLKYNDQDISNLSQTIQTFLKKNGASSKISYMIALCVDELATDIVAQCRMNNVVIANDRSIMDIKIIMEKSAFDIIICNMAQQYNPLDHEYANDDFSKVGLMMVQKIAEKIDYNYICKMNMIMMKIKR